MICQQRIAKRDFILERVNTGDEKWILYHNVKRKHHWLNHNINSTQQPRSELHPKNILLALC